jgi:hypothetical protein
MALATSTILGLGAAAGGVAGAVKGAMGTPEQRLETILPNMTPEQSKALQQSLSMFQSGQQQIGQQEQDIMARLGLQGQARDALGSAFGGQMFQMTPQEQAAIAAQRQASIQANEDSIGRMLTDRLGQIGAGSAARGVRGQALSELQGQAARGASEQMQSAVNAANMQAAQQAMTMPYQRAQMQLGAAQNFATFSDMLRQQAIQNRMQFQMPGALDLLSRERMAQATRVTPGQQGSWMDALTGAIGGAGAFGSSMGNLAQGFNSVQGINFGGQSTPNPVVGGWAGGNPFGGMV